MLATPLGRRAALPPIRLDADLKLLFLLINLAGALVFLFPLASMALAGFLLLNLPASTPRSARWVLTAILVLSMSLMTGARPLLPDESNDIDGYYDIYEDIRAGDLEELTHFGGGFEVTMTSLFLLWGTVLPKLTPNGLMFCLGLTSATLFAVWVEATFYREEGLTPPALVGVCLVMLNLYFSTQLVRQFLSMVLLLFAMSARGAWRPWFWVAVAATVHLTAIPFYVLWLLVKRGWKGWVAVLVLAVIVRVYFADLLVAFDVLPEAIAEKLKYYLDNDEESSSSDLGSLRMVSLLGLISLLVVFMKRWRPQGLQRLWVGAPWITAAVHLLLLPVPLASLRTTLAIHSVVPGLLAYTMFDGAQARTLRWVVNLLLLYKIATLATAEASANLSPTLTIVAGFFA